MPAGATARRPMGDAAANAREPTRPSPDVRRASRHALRITLRSSPSLVFAREAHRDRASDFGRVSRTAAVDRRVPILRRTLAGPLTPNAPRIAAPPRLATSAAQPPASPLTSPPKAERHAACAAALRLASSCPCVCPHARQIGTQIGTPDEAQFRLVKPRRPPFGPLWPILHT